MVAEIQLNALQRLYLARTQQGESTAVSAAGMHVDSSLDPIELQNRLDAVCGAIDLLGCRISVRDTQWALVPDQVDRCRILVEGQVTVPDTAVADCCRRVSTAVYDTPIAVSLAKTQSDSTATLVVALAGWVGDARAAQLILECLTGTRTIRSIATLQATRLKDWLEAPLSDDEADHERSTMHALVRRHGVIADAMSTGHVDLAGLENPESALSDLDEAQWLAAFLAVIGRRYPDNRIGVYVDGRAFDELETVIGPLTRQVPLALDPEQWSIAPDVAAVRAALDDTTESADAFCWPEDRADYSLPFAFRYDAYGIDSYHASDGHHVFLEARAGRLSRLTFASSFWKKEEADIFAEQLLCVAHQISTHSSRPRQGPFGFVPAAHRRAARTWGDGPTLTDDAASFLERFGCHVQSASDSNAVVGAQTTWSYGELNDIGNQLAHFLIEEGVKVGDRVGICLPRCERWIASVLGVMKAGASFVPLDPAVPTARIHAIQEQAQLAAILTQTEYADRISDGPREIPLVDWELDADLIAGCPKMHPERVPIACQEAYVIFTSGTTGQPKGVSVSHGNLAHYVRGLEERLDIAQVGSFAALSTVAADLGYTAIFGALACGRSLRVLPESLNLDAEALAAELSRQPVDVMKIVPSHLRALLSAQHPERVLPRRVLILGGEKPGGDLLTQLRELAPDLRIINHYGPTETTIGAIASPAPLTGVGNPPLGRPLANVSCYIVDSSLEIVPLLCEGELVIGGPGVSDGYVGNPRDTARLFVPDPYRHGARAYCSGDRASFLSDGQIVFHGRRDSQVKLRGHRIELGEIEAAIVACDGVDAAVVTVRDEHTSPRVVAYASGTLKDEAILRASVANTLPDYMVPSAWVFLATIPLNANGKIDLQALPDPVDVRQASCEAHAEPADGSPQAILLSIARDLLRNSSIGSFDNFFSVGGDSIVAIQLVARARQQGLILKPRDVFDAPTIAQMAAVVVSAGARDAEETLAATGRSPLSPIQARLLARLEEDHAQYNQAALIQLDDQVSADTVAAAVDVLLRHHDVLRAVFPADDQGVQVQDVCDPAQAGTDGFWLRTIDRDGWRESLEAVVREAQAGFAIDRGPLVRFVWITGGPSPLLLIVAHHLVIDAYSWSIVEEDLHALINGERRLPPVSASYRAWSTRIAELTNQGAFDGELSFWRDQLGDSPAEFATQSSSNTVACARNETLILDPQLTALMHSDVHDTFATSVQDLLVTAFAMAVGQWTESTSVPVMMEGHGRDAVDMDVSRTVGWFTSMYPLALRVDPASEKATIKGIKEQLRGVTCGGLGYGALRYVQKRAELDVPEPGICLNYLGRLGANSPGTPSEWAAELERLAQVATRADEQQRLFQWEVVGMETDAGIAFNIVFDPARHTHAQIRDFLSLFEKSIQRVVAVCRDEAGEFTASDLADVDMTQEEVDVLINDRLAELF